MAEAVSERVLPGVQANMFGYYQFRAYVHDCMQAMGECLYALAAIDIDHFKLFNEMYGRDAGDDILLKTAGHLKNYAAERNGVAGYFGNDDFALFIPWEKLHTRQLYKHITGIGGELYQKGFSPSVGLHIIRNGEEDFDDMYDRAITALNSVRESFTEHIAVYDHDYHGAAREKHKLLIDIHRGLAEEEFTFFLQPKCAMDSGKIIGAEALVRWIHAERGIVSPGDFISVMEDHNCISALDMYIWEEVCKWQRTLLDEGVEPLPCSVNVSRVDFECMDVAEHFRTLIKRYDIAPSLIELEITESAFVDGKLDITSTVERLRADGFKILMDDFGAGTSSLNSLRDLKFDVLKTDIRFLDKTGQSRAGLDLMESVLNIASLLGVPLIVEGAETRDQIEDLLSIGCSYAQGFYFHQPMHRDHYKKLITRQHNVERGGLVKGRSGDLRVSDILENNLYSKETLNSILGAVALIELIGDHLHVEMINDRMKQVLVNLFPGESTPERMKFCLNQRPEYIRKLFHIAEINLVDGCRDALLVRDKDGKMMNVLLRIFLLQERDGVKLFYLNVANVEPEPEYEDLRQELRETKEHISFLVSALDRLPNPVFIKDSEARFLFFNEQYAKTFGMRQEDYIGKTVMELDYLPQEDRQRFQQEDEELIRTETRLNYESDFLFSDELMHFSLYWSSGIHDKRTGRRGLVGEIVDITRERLVQQKLDAAVVELQNSNLKLEEMAYYDSGTGLFNRTILNRKEEEFKSKGMAVKTCALMCDLDYFKRVNDTYGHTEGDAILAKFGKLLMQECRYDDMPIRYGGEEFLLFLNNEPLEAGEAVAERIRQRCENEILLPNGEAITVSIGVAMLDPARSLVENIKNVDRYLYAAKDNGRNCVMTESTKRGWIRWARS